MQLQVKKKPLEYKLSDDKILTLTLPQFVDRECAFILGVRKSGSSLLGNIIISLCRYNKVPHVSIAEQAFKQNLRFKDWSRAQELGETIRDGAFYLGFRALPEFLASNKLFQERRKILLVRDPRDAIVSQFFTVAFNHKVPQKNDQNANGARETLLNKRKLVRNQPIDEYVIENALGLHNTIQAYIKFIDSPNMLIFRYEDILMNKRSWIQEMANFLELELSEKMLQNILNNVDIVPHQENPKNFIRKAIPGDYKDKLQPQTIEQLNKVFADILEQFNYQ